jgi:hypothetical protein
MAPAAVHPKGKGTAISSMEVARKKPSEHRVISTDLLGCYVMPINLTMNGTMNVRIGSPRSSARLLHASAIKTWGRRHHLWLTPILSYPTLLASRAKRKSHERTRKSGD